MSEYHWLYILNGVAGRIHELCDHMSERIAADKHSTAFL